MHAMLAASDAWLRPHALAPALARPCLASSGFACMLGSLPLMHGSGFTRHALALALAWLCLASYGCACMLGLLSLMHGPGITPSLSLWPGSASPRMAVDACWACCL
jgi:hypothetical protein